ncbi:MAG TPA: hypothetical protein PLK12_07700 [Prolixibacteraceae bacterium]|nr:hypothetical protein [Prolixibacteraceae bacterium]
MNKWIYLIATAIVLMLLLLTCPRSCNKKPGSCSGIHPPIHGVNVPWEVNSFLAETGDTLFYPSGSILIFPSHSLVDEKGNTVEGEVTVFYREFQNPVDFFIGGIPMNYDSSGISYVFESSGMFEISARKGKKPVYIHPQNKPEINLASTNNDPIPSVYYLDTLQKQWIYKGKDVLTCLDLPERKQPEGKALYAPVKPQKASGNRPVFTISVESEEVADLMAYHNLRFEVAEEETNYDPRYASIEWNNVGTKRGPIAGTIRVTFSNENDTVSFLTRPVVKGSDYEAAMEIYARKKKEYEEKQILRYEKEEAARKEQERIERINRLIEARNREIEALQRKSEGMFIQKTVIRSFFISNFGYWNCDEPFSWGNVTITARFVNENEEELKFESVFMAYKSRKSIQRFNSNQITFNPQEEIIIWGIANGRIAYLLNEDFRTYVCGTNQRACTIRMHVYPGLITSREEVSGLLGI